MKVLQFTIPVPGDKNIIVQQESMPFFYPHLHRHDELQLTWIQRGEGTLVVGNNMHPFRSNEIYCIAPNQPHVFKSDPSYFEDGSAKMVKAMTIFFNPNGKLQYLLDLAEARSIKTFLQKHRNGFAVPEEETGAITRLMTRISRDNGLEQLISFLELLRCFTGLQQLTELSTFTDMAGVTEHEGIRLGHIYHYIMDHYADQLTLEDVAKEAHMTPQAFCRYFKKRTRHTFVSFLNEVRIHEACKRLTDGAVDSISTIAYTCGFNSITNFNRVFKSIIGKSPSEYLESYYHNTLEVAS
ncbi:helix-turn-helix domain-containing protein [Flavihumibacter petaseus]|uniref:Putative AraC family transcriptional regulator n=1 Tax=Flavihumibacter petaseus NBRC 106054 TaxID=1220578 RepID=A0A0E9MWI9_9BACT|nr:helix-turn-helix domain-containing protein [Flavihumibacter petaseus]GAO42112.1 putative AraC family transcriptional regulator [Flavihumibacter petaseus NBRC 106054]